MPNITLSSRYSDAMTGAAVSSFDRVEKAADETSRALNNTTAASQRVSNASALAVTGNTKHAESSDRLTRSVVNAGQSIKAFALTAVASYASIQGVQSVIGAAIQNTVEHERAMIRLTSQNFLGAEAVERLTDRLQRQTAVSDDLIINAIATGKALGLSEDAAVKYAIAALEASKAVGEDFNTVHDQLLKTLDGSLGRLNKMFPALKTYTTEQIKAGAAAEYFIKQFGGTAAAQADTFGGRIDNLNESVGDLTQSLGDFFVALDNGGSSLQVARVSVDEISSGLSTLSEQLQSLSGKEWKINLIPILGSSFPIPEIGGTGADLLSAASPGFSNQQQMEALAKFLVARQEASFAEQSRVEGAERSAALEFSPAGRALQFFEILGPKVELAGDEAVAFANALTNARLVVEAGERLRGISDFAPPVPSPTFNPFIDGPDPTFRGTSRREFSPAFGFTSPASPLFYPAPSGSETTFVSPEEMEEQWDAFFDHNRASLDDFTKKWGKDTGNMFDKMSEESIAFGAITVAAIGRAAAAGEDFGDVMFNVISNLIAFASSQAAGPAGIILGGIGGLITGLIQRGSSSSTARVGFEPISVGENGRPELESVGGDVPIVLQLDGRTVARGLIPHDRVARRRGQVYGGPR